MQLTFSRSGVDRLIAHSKAAPKHRPTYGQAEPIPPGLWLVGDDGVYLMSNGQPGLLQPGEKTKQFVVYATECDPTKMSFEAWWDAKQRSFGGDDGVEFIKLSDIEDALATYPPGTPLMLDVSPQEIGIVGFGRRPDGDRPPPRKHNRPPAGKSRRPQFSLDSLEVRSFIKSLEFLRSLAVAECNGHVRHYIDTHGSWHFAPSRLAKNPTRRNALIEEFKRHWPKAAQSRLAQMRRLNTKLARICPEWRKLTDEELLALPPEPTIDVREWKL
jgi:DUF3085 family protein